MRTVKTLIRLAASQADLSLRWAHMPFCWFCNEAAHIRLKTNQAQKGFDSFIIFLLNYKRISFFFFFSFH